ncbi:MAG TPA: DUF2958 domain-containing protein [Terriglobales bacterium]|nr:DUF2958 domain-containing protein [Terriglobales bacterium]
MTRQLLTDDLRQRLLVNGSVGREVDHVPLVKIFDPAGAATWLLSELLPAEEGGDPGLLFGLCDLGFGFPEMGYVSLAELEAVKGRLGIGLERDLCFQGRFPLSVYAEAARRHGRIVESDAALIDAARHLNVSRHSPPPDESGAG